jgi:hypothetical protein
MIMAKIKIRAREMESLRSPLSLVSVIADQDT